MEVSTSGKVTMGFAVLHMAGEHSNHHQFVGINNKFVWESDVAANQVKDMHEEAFPNSGSYKVVEVSFNA